LGIRLICDLRTKSERRRHPDRLPSSFGITYRHIPMKSRHHDDSGVFAQLCSLVFGKARRMRFDEVMEEVYREYVADFGAELAAVLRLTADPEHLPILIHCTAGKDRTGLACVLIHRVLGASPEAIMGDYLCSNDHFTAFRRDITRRLRRFSVLGVSTERVLPLFEARREYVEAAFDEMTRRHGSFDAYVEEGLKVTDVEKKRLRELLLEPAPADFACG
jgi:protein-tyrosine phosphatase